MDVTVFYDVHSAVYIRRTFIRWAISLLFKIKTIQLVIVVAATLYSPDKRDISINMPFLFETSLPLSR